MGITYRLATPSELDPIFEVRTSVRENHLGMDDLAERGITPALYANWLRTGEVITHCALDGDDVLGFSGVRPASAEVFALFVREEAHGQGIGGRLLELAEQALADAGCATVSLETGRGTRAHGFYLRRGWVECERPATSPEDVTLEKVLDPLN